MPQYDYVLDTSGTLAANRITKEIHTITQINGRDYNFIIPRFAPFFGVSMRVFLQEGLNQTRLIEGVTWSPAAKFSGASLATGKPIYGAISFNDVNFSGDIVLEYQTLGDEYTLDVNKMTEVLANIIYNPRGLTWEELSGLPKMFPPIDHPWDYQDMVGMKEVNKSLGDIEQAILNKAASNFNLPPVTKASIGLGQVEDHPPSTIAEGLAGTAHNRNVTPLVLKGVLEELELLNMSDTIREFRQHIARRDNPNNVTKGQLDLSNVENLPVATPSDILAKRRVRRYVTLEQLQDYLALHGCRPEENPDQEFPPKDALLSVYCHNLNRLGVYADGIGGSYEKVIEVNSRDCGYIPPQPTQFPVQGTVIYKYCSGVDQWAVIADGFGGTISQMARVNSPDCGYTGVGTPGSHPVAGTILGTRCDGTTLVRTVANGSGGSIEERDVNSPQCSAGAPTHPPADKLLSTYCQGYDLRGRYSDGGGGQYTAIITRNSDECGYQPPAPPVPVPPPPPPPTYQPPPPPPPPPPATSNLQVLINFDRTSISVGARTNMNTSVTGMVSGNNYTITWYRQGRNGAFNQYQNPQIFTASGSSRVFTLGVDNNGDVVSGSYAFKAIVQEAGSGSKESNISAINYTANRTVSLTLNGASSYLNEKVGNNVKVDINFRDFPIYGSATETQPLPWYLMIRGADSRNVGEGSYAEQTNSVGAASTTFTNTLLANADIRGIVTYQVVVSWKEFDGSIQTSMSNAVSVFWAGDNAPPPPPPPTVNHPAANTLLRTFCDGTTKMGEYADGNGGKFNAVIQINSSDCGYKPPAPPTVNHPANGTLLRSYCSGTTNIGVYANGTGGSYERVIAVNDAGCGYTPPPPPPTPPPPPVVVSAKIHDVGGNNNWPITNTKVDRLTNLLDSDTNLSPTGGFAYVSGRIGSPFADHQVLKYFSIRYHRIEAKVLWSNAESYDVNPRNLPSELGGLYLSSWYDTARKQVFGTDGLSHWLNYFTNGIGSRFGTLIRDASGNIMNSPLNLQLVNISSVDIRSDGTFNLKFKVSKLVNTNINGIKDYA